MNGERQGKIDGHNLILDAMLDNLPVSDRYVHLKSKGKDPQHEGLSDQQIELLDRLATCKRMSDDLNSDPELQWDVYKFRGLMSKAISSIEWLVDPYETSSKLQDIVAAFMLLLDRANSLERSKKCSRGKLKKRREFERRIIKQFEALSEDLSLTTRYQIIANQMKGVTAKVVGNIIRKHKSG